METHRRHSQRLQVELVQRQTLSSGECYREGEAYLEGAEHLGHPVDKLAPTRHQGTKSSECRGSKVDKPRGLSKVPDGLYSGSAMPIS